MAVSLNIKDGDYMEMYTELPCQFGREKREIPVFFWNGNQWIIEFVSSKDRTFYYDLLIRKLSYDEFKPFEIDFWVGFKNEENLSLGKRRARITSYGNYQLWGIKIDALTQKLPSDFYDGNILKFLFRFRLMKDTVLNLRSMSQHKSIQTGSYLNSYASVESLTEDFSKLLDKGSYHDAVIKCGEHCLNVHKAVLCARSEVFKTMLESDFLEGQTGVVQIQDMDACCFREFLLYLYTGTMPELTYEKAKTLYEAGDKYAVRSLMLRCSEYLQDNLSRENAFECYVLGDAHSDQQLKDQIKTYLLDEKVYLEEEYWALFCEKFPKMAAQVCSLSHRKRKFEEE